MLYVGQMSGTSSDGLDLAAIDRSHKLIHFQTYQYSSDFRNQLLCLNASSSLQEKNKANTAFSNFVVESLLQFQSLISQPMIVGFHGHTLVHNPAERISTYIGDAQKIAKALACKVVADFRKVDINNGGQGAPLAPLFHREIFSTAGVRGVLNLGGIANLSILKGNELLIGFDTGPANTLIDSICKKHFGQNFDEAGELGKQGVKNDALLMRMLDDPYFSKHAPKSTGREYFNEHWLQFFLRGCVISPIDLISTLVELNVYSIKKAIELHKIQLDDLVVCGGGVKNIYFMRRLHDVLGIKVLPSHSLGWHEDCIEACAWAWMAHQHEMNIKVDAQQITGASAPYVPGISYNPVA